MSASPATSQRALHPATVLVTAACVWVLVVTLNNPWVSVGAVVAATVIAVTWASRVTILVLTLPVLLSMIVVHAPYGEHRIAPFITSDGLLAALALTARFMALIACVIAAVSRLTVVDLVKWVQVSRAGYRLAYIVGSSLQFLPQGAAAVRSVSDAQLLSGDTGSRFGRDATPRRRHAVMPVISRLLTQGVQRGQSLVAVGFDQPGPRTVLRPVPDSSWQRIYRWTLPLATLAIMIGVLAW